MRGVWTDNIAVFPAYWIWETRPVYHLRRENFAHDETRVSLFTRCGIELQAWDSESGETFRDRQTVMRREHAEKFARLCGNCAKAAS